MKPSHFYFDQDILNKEQILFNHSRYLGHELLVNNYYVLPQDNNGKVLVKNSRGIECLSNVCRHRQAIMLNRSGQIRNIVCPLHGWTYDLDGKLIGAPEFETCPEKHLKKYPTQNWNGILFEKYKFDIVSDLNKIKLSNYFNFSNYVFHSKKEHICNYNWKTFIEVYLDDYHVKPFHPGLGNFVDCNNLNWQFGDWYSVQSVGINNKLQTPGTPVYKKWHKVLMDYRKNSVPDFGAIWLTIYPNVMVEWYPEVLVISTVWPDGPQKTKNIVEFYYPEEITHFESEFVEAHQAAYMETCFEDDEIAERMDRGRLHLYKNNTSDFGPVHEPMEVGLNYFYKYYDNYIFTFS